MRAMPCNVKTIVKCVVKVVVSHTHLTLKCENRHEMYSTKKIFAMRAKPWNAKVAIKCVLQIDISHTREALKCEIRMGYAAKIQI